LIKIGDKNLVLSPLKDWMCLLINYWVISPYDSSDKYLYQRAWRFCLEHKTISVGHTVPDDLKNKNEEEFFDIICKYYHNLTNAWLTRKNREWRKIWAKIGI